MFIPFRCTVFNIHRVHMYSIFQILAVLEANQEQKRFIKDDDDSRRIVSRIFDCVAVYNIIKTYEG